MKLLNLYSIKGPNIYSYNPVIVLEIDLEEYQDVYTDELPNLTNNLLRQFPGLYDHHCSKGYPGGLVERIQKGTLLGHLIEHLALELQSLITKPVHFGKTRYAEEIQGYRIIYSYRNEALGLEAGRQAYSCIDALLKGEAVDATKIKAHLEETYFRGSYGPSTQAVIDAAIRREIPVLPLSSRSSLIQLGYGANQKRIQATTTSNTSCISVDLACDKWETREILSQMGLPIAKGSLVNSEEEALSAMEELGTPVVVKPLDGNQGKGVTLNILTSWELKKAFKLGKHYSEMVLVEEYVQGNDYRLTVVNGELVAASLRQPPFVIGDGVHNIRQLIQMINSDSQRGEGHEKPLTRIKIEQVVLLTLARQNLNLDSILAEGQQIFLRDNGNLSTGGTAYDVTDQVHPENRQLVERAVRLIGLDVAGVDLRTPDISLPVSKYGGAIIEVNASPGIRMHHYPTAGKERSVADYIVKMLFLEGQGRIPIFAITGTNGKTTTTRLIQHILQQTGKRIGMTTTDGIYLNRDQIYEGDTTGYWSTQVILKDPSVDMAVLEIARGGMIRSGLGFDRSDVGIVLNVSEDHLGLKGINTLEELAGVKALIAETVKKEGVCVLNGDDPYTAKMARRTLGRVIFFSQNPDNPVIQEHIQGNGIAVVTNSGYLEIWTGQAKQKIIDLAQVSFTHHGKARHQVENMLAAVAGLFGFGLSIDLICDGLKSFSNDIQSNPGRLNIVEDAGWKLILDYGHNLEGYRAIIDYAKNLGYRRLLGVIGVPGDRSDESIIKVGKLAGDHFDLVWVKEDEDLRDRNQGDVADLLIAGLHQGKNSSKIQVIYQEKEALKVMLKNLQSGDVGVIFYEKDPKDLLNTIEEFIVESKESLQMERELVVNSSY